MKHFNPFLYKDVYKVDHKPQYPDDLELVYSNLTPRSSRIDDVDKVVAFGFQYFVLEYLQTQFNNGFFKKPVDQVIKEYKRVVDSVLGPGAVDYKHVGELWENKKLPIHVKAVPEGTLVPLRVPTMTIASTDKKFGWFTNSIETLQSNILWMPSTSATTAFRYRKTFESFAKLTGAPKEFIKWQGHDFSMRGMAGIEASCLSAAGHALSFTGSDTLPVVSFLEEYYYANCEKELIIGSVPATEHSVMCVGKQDGELATITRLITKVYPKGIVSIVSDTWDFWKVLTEYLLYLRETILAREGKVVIRPDSGDPVLILCGDPASQVSYIRKGAVEALWDIFGGAVNKAGFKELDPHIGLIYGDSITPERQTEILKRLAAKGFASSNVVLGIGSYTYQHVTRDTYGWAIKATYAETTSGGGQAIFKAPKTDDGIKNSAVGLLRIEQTDKGLALLENQTWKQEAGGVLQTIFKDGVAYNQQTLASIRARVESYL